MHWPMCITSSGIIRCSGRILARWPETSQLSATRSASQHFAAFVDTLGDRLSAKRRGLYEKSLLIPGYRPSGPKTLVHGDAHWGNFLYPYDPTAYSLYLIDWAVWHVNSGVGDLAYTIALQCYPERRAMD